MAAAVTRGERRAGQLAELGIRPIVADITDPSSLASIPAVDTILFAVGFDRSSDHSIEEVYVSGLANLLAALPETPRRFVYISSTGVYGDADGEVIDEQSPTHPTRPGGKAHLAAEKLLLESQLGDRATILRCAGLYGPGRIPRLKDVQLGQPIPANPDACINLIHVDDAAQIVCEVAEAQPPSQVYCVSDGSPPTRREFYEHLAMLHGAPPPTFATPDDESTSRRSRTSNKRISNRRLMDELRITLQYPTYREGLAAIET